MVKAKIQFSSKADSSQDKKNKFLAPEQVRYGAGPTAERSAFTTGQTEGIAKAVTFLKETLGKEGSLIKATKKDDGWEVEIEVVEQSEYMKRIGIAKPVYDKNVYRVLFDRNFDLVSYDRKSQKPTGGAVE